MRLTIRIFYITSIVTAIEIFIYLISLQPARYPNNFPFQSVFIGSFHINTIVDEEGEDASRDFGWPCGLSPTVRNWKYIIVTFVNINLWPW